MQEIIISIFEVVGDNLCVTSDNGQKVYERIFDAFNKNRVVILSFRNISLLTPTFLNVAIGQLYGKFNEKQIRTLLKVKNIKLNDLILLQRVVKTAKEYFKDLQKVNKSITNII